MPSFSSSHGQPIRLGQKIGVGGEGTVYDVAGQPDIVAKIYHQALTDERANKIRAMLSLADRPLRQMTAWPSDLVLVDKHRVVGLLMPKVTGHNDVHKLYSPKSRKANFPSATFPFLVHAAGNIARAFATLHAAGCVIGDVNHGSVTVSGKATVKLIDCDSFQVQADRQLYLCEVAVPTFTPPELQGRSLRGVVRTPNHDNFGLAVLIFHLLFMGRHPFAGRYLGRGDMTIEAAIEQFRFAYGQNRQRIQMEPPPHVPPLTAASIELARLFETAFGREGCKEGGRPTSAQWIVALDGLAKTLVSCRADPTHAYVPTLGSCPWCDVEAATGAQLFNVLVLPTTDPDLFDIVTVWRTIESSRLQPATPPPDPDTIGPLTPSLSAKKAGVFNRWLKRAVAVFCASTAMLAGMLTPNYFMVWALMGSGLYYLLARVINVPATATFKKDASQAEARYKAALAHLNKSPPRSVHLAFKAKRRQLEALRLRWNELPAKRATRLRRLEAERQEQQLEKFLSNFFIDHADIRDIGPGRKATLASYGIETAADLTRRRVTKVPGFGDVMTAKLLTWRNKVSQNFTFDPAKGVDRDRVADLDREILKERRQIEVSIPWPKKLHAGCVRK